MRIWYEVQQAFENYILHSPFYVSHNFKKSNFSGYVYENGEINRLFETFLAGYSLAKSLARQNNLTLED